LSWERAKDLLGEAADEVGGKGRVSAVAVAVLAAAAALWVLTHGTAPEPIALGDGGTGGGVSIGAGKTGGVGASSASGGSAGSRPGSSPSSVDGVSGAKSGVVVVYVAGAVKRPGLVKLGQGARIADAISGAGGLALRADAADLNLAALVSDGDEVYVRRVGEAPPALGGGAGAGSAARASPGGGGANGGPAAATAAGAGAAGAGPLDLNRATLADLDGLPGIGPVLAQRILDVRASKGRFASVDELRDVEGIGQKKFDQLKASVTVR
jgi:competence protein ComEA